MMRASPAAGAALASLMLVATAGWSQEAGSGDDQAQDEATAAEAAPEAPADAATEAPEAEAGAEAATEAPEAEAGAEAAPAGHAGMPDVAVAREEDGRYYTAEDTPTFSIAEDGTVDWLTFSGFRRYHAECHVCHGPDGEGSSYAPNLTQSVLRLDYYEFYGIVAGGKQEVGGGNNRVMPAFGDNANVMCYLDDIYVYLLARGAGDLPRGRPAQRQDKSDAIGEAEDACMGT